MPSLGLGVGCTRCRSRVLPTASTFWLRCRHCVVRGGNLLAVALVCLRCWRAVAVPGGPSSTPFSLVHWASSLWVPAGSPSTSCSLGPWLFGRAACCAPVVLGSLGAPPLEWS